MITNQNNNNLIFDHWSAEGVWDKTAQPRIISYGKTLFPIIAALAFFSKMVDVLLAVVGFLWLTYLWENYLSYRQVRH